MKDVMKAALATAAETVADLSGFEDDPEMRAAIAEIADMLRYASKNASSPLLQNLKSSVTASGGDGHKREQDAIALAVAAFFMLQGFGQNKAALAAVQLVGHSSKQSIKRGLKGASAVESLKRLDQWPELEERIARAKRLARIRSIIDPAFGQLPEEVQCLDVLIYGAG